MRIASFILNRRLLKSNVLLFPCLLVACHEGDKVVIVNDPLPVRKIESVNFVDAAAVAMLAYRRSVIDNSNVATAGFQLIINQKPPGLHACANAGNLNMEKVGSDYLFTAINCDIGGVQLISGSFTINMESGYVYQFKSLNYRVEGDTGSQSLTGQLRSTNAPGASTTTGSFTVERNRRSDVYTNYSITGLVIPNAKHTMSININTPRFPHPLKAEYEISDNALVLNSMAEDGSNASMTLIKDGAIKIELRNQVGGAIILSKTISNVELSAAIAKVTD